MKSRNIKTNWAILRERLVQGCKELTGSVTQCRDTALHPPGLHAQSHTSSYGPISKHRHLFFIPLPTVAGFFYPSHLTWKASVVNATVLLFIKSISSPDD